MRLLINRHKKTDGICAEYSVRNELATSSNYRFFFFYVISLINDRFVMIKLAVPTPKKGWSQPEHIQYWGVPYVLLLVVWMHLVVTSVVVLTRI